MAISDNASGRSLVGLVSRFLTVGAINTILTFLLYQALILAVPYRAAYSASFAVGIAFSAAANSRFVFDVRLGFGAALRFTLFYLASYAIGLVLLTVLVGILGVSPRLAPFIVVPIMLPVNFIGSRLALNGAAAMPRKDPRS